MVPSRLRHYYIISVRFRYSWVVGLYACWIVLFKQSLWFINWRLICGCTLVYCIPYIVRSVQTFVFDFFTIIKAIETFYPVFFSVVEQTYKSKTTGLVTRQNESEVIFGHQGGYLSIKKRLLWMWKLSRNATMKKFSASHQNCKLCNNRNGHCG